MKLLDYTKEDLDNLSTKELEELYHKCEMMQEQKSTGQLTKKVLINGLYGALANTSFILFNEKIAQSITGNGRYFIQKTANMIEKVLQAKFSSPDKYVIYGDTDSVTGDTVLNVMDGMDVGSEKSIRIDELYDSGFDEVEYKKGKFLRKVHAEALSLENGEAVYKPVTYVMKHKVKKHLYKITINGANGANGANGKSVIVTEDHSVMVERDGVLIECKPTEIKKGDKVITLAFN